MPASSSDLFARGLRLLLLTVLFGAAGYYVYVSWQWPLLRDSSVMHYVNFLIDHGMRPYREISDNNLPGAYLADRFGVLLFGGGDLAWRAYDLFLLAVITASMIVIALPYDWAAGLAAGLLFALLHGSEGPDFAVEREEIVTALLMAASALLLVALRRRHPTLLLLFGLLAGMASSIKPTVALYGIVLLLAAVMPLRWQGDRSLRSLLYGFAGILLAAVIVLGYLLGHNAIRPLLFILRDILPSYVSLSNKSLLDLLRAMMPLNLLPSAALAAVLAWQARAWNRERWLLLLGMLLGAASYIAQRKGSIYHRYPFLAFLLLLIVIELLTALRRHSWPQWLAAAGIASIIFVSVPHYLHELRASPGNSTMRMALGMADDLRRLRGADLQRQVECLDLTYGCFSALYRDGLVENNGFTGDLMLFAPHHSAAEDFYRKQFWTGTMASPPAVFVVSNEWFPQELNFAKLDTWPEFRQYLEVNYTLALQREFPVPHDSGPVPAYRIYIRNGSPLLASVPH